MGTMHGSWLWYELMSPDAAGSKAFYEAVVPGWRVSPGTPETGGYGFIANADGGMTGGLFEVTEEMREHGARHCWLGYVGVDDVDAFLPRLEAAGGKVLMPARDVEIAGRIAMVADCCGTPFYVMTPTPPPGGGESTAFSQTLHGRCGWNELLAGNQANALKFYTGLFGWTLPEPMDMGPMGTYQFINHDDAMIGAVMQAPESAPKGWYPYFRVASIEAAKVAVEAHGGKVMNGPMEVPGGDWIVQGIDPQGAMFSLVGGQ
jgi:predicted enzyme related to lactoylglutathione lyase